MSENALAAAIRPQSYASSTTGAKKSTVLSTAVPSASRRTAAASSPWSRPTMIESLGTPINPGDPHLLQLPGGDLAGAATAVCVAGQAHAADVGRLATGARTRGSVAYACSRRRLGTWWAS